MGITLVLDGETGGPELWAEHVPAWRAWCVVSGQWRTASVGMGGLVWIGLDYAAARAGLDLAGIEIGPETWAELRVIEVGAAQELNRDR